MTPNEALYKGKYYDREGFERLLYKNLPEKEKEFRKNCDDEHRSICLYYPMNFMKEWALENCDNLDDNMLEWGIRDVLSHKFHIRINTLYCLEDSKLLTQMIKDEVENGRLPTQQTKYKEKWNL